MQFKFLQLKFVTLIPVTVIKNPWTTRKKKVVFSSLKMNMAMPSITTRGSDYMLSSGASGMTISTQTVLPITGHLWALLFVIDSGMQSKKNILFYGFALGDRRLIHCGRRTTTAGSSLSCLGNLRRRHPLVLATWTMVASASKRTLQNPWIPMKRQMNYLMCLDRRKWRREQPQFLPWASLRRCANYLLILTLSLESEGQFEQWGMQGLLNVSDIPITYLVFLIWPSTSLWL